jgi:molybdenum cofactor biosynthesis protein B
MNIKKVSLACAVLTVSNTCTAGNDTSGNLLAEAIAHAGHQCVRRDIVKKNIYQIRRIISDWIADARVQVIIIAGGTGFSHRHSTSLAITPLLDEQLPGFGERLRHIFYEENGSAALHSRALAGFANHTLIFSLPGSTEACHTAWTRLLRDQLDSTHQPSNFATQFDSSPTAHLTSLL